MAANKHPHPGPGRPPGARNRRTSDQLLEAKRAVAEARATGRKLAKEIADDFMHVFANMAMEVRPVTQREIERGVPPNPRADEGKFRIITAILLQWVALLMPYQSARLQTIKLDVGEFDGEAEDVGALETLERLLDAYAEADAEDRRFRAAREVKGREVEEPEVESENTLVAVRPASGA
jgi:hypothetical protein